MHTNKRCENVTRAYESAYNITNDIRKGGQKKKLK